MDHPATNSDTCIVPLLCVYTFDRSPVASFEQSERFVNNTRDGYEGGFRRIACHVAGNKQDFHRVPFLCIDSVLERKKSRETRTCVITSAVVAGLRWIRVRRGAASNTEKPRAEGTKGAEGEQEEQKRVRREGGTRVYRVPCTWVYRVSIQRETEDRENNNEHTAETCFEAEKPRSREVESANRTHTAHRFQSPPVGSVVSEPSYSSDVASTFSDFSFS